MYHENMFFNHAFGLEDDMLHDETENYYDEWAMWSESHGGTTGDWVEAIESDVSYQTLHERELLSMREWAQDVARGLNIRLDDTQTIKILQIELEMAYEAGLIDGIENGQSRIRRG